MERNGKRTERPLPQNAGARPRNTARNRSAAPQNMWVRAGGRRRKRGPNRGCFVVVLLCLLAAITLAVVWLTWDQQPEGDPVLPAEEQEQTTQPSEETPQEQPSDQQQTEEQPADEEQTGEQTEEQSQYEQLAQQFAQEKQEYYLLLANTDNPLPEDWTVETEEVQNGYEMDARVAPAMREMIDAAAADGVDLLVCSAYRSIEKQQSLFDTSVQNYMAQGMTEEEATARFPAPASTRPDLRRTSSPRPTRRWTQNLPTPRQASGSASTPTSTDLSCATRRTSRMSPVSSTSRGTTALSAKPTPN